MRKYFRTLFLAAVFVMLFSSCAYAARGKASTKPILLPSGTEVSGYDLDMDGKADRVKILAGNVISIDVYINGTFVQTLNPSAIRLTPTVYLIAPKKKSTYLAVRSDTTQTGYLDLYRYKKGRFIKVYSASLGEEATAYPLPYKVSRNELVVRDRTGRYESNIFGTEADFLVKYTLKGKTVRLKSRYAKITGKKNYKVSYDYRTSSKKTAANEKGPVLKAGQTVKVIRMYIPKTGEYQSYQVKVNGKKGWIVMRHDDLPERSLLY